MLHIASDVRAGKSIRTLCGVWNVPTVENTTKPGHRRRRMPKEACPACRRKANGGN